MVRVNTEHTYADMDDSLRGEITVYVDVSVAAERDPKRGKRAYVPSAAGWAIAGENDVLRGYGVSLIWDEYEKDSSISELRAILRFLDTLYQYSPDLLVKTNRFNIRCDNRMLMEALCNGGKTQALSKKMFSKYGNDYTRIVYYMTRTNFTFKWVRGHSTDPFNCLADKMAYKCRNAALAEDGFSGKAREEYINHLLGLSDAKVRRNNKQKKVPAPAEGSNTVVLFPTYYKKRNENSSTALFVYLNKNTKELKYVGEKVTDLSRSTISLKALSYALFNYRMSKTFDINNPVLIKSKMHILVQIMEALVSGEQPNISLSDKKAHAQLENLSVLMSGMNIKAVYDISDTAAVIDSIGNVIGNDYGKISFNAKEHRKRVAKCLQRL